MTTVSATRAAWLAALSDLERELELVEAVLDAPGAPELPGGVQWTPPSGLGPLPEDLLERASLLLQRQRTTAERLPAQLASSKRQRDVAGRLAGGVPARALAPAFVDQAL